MKKCTKSLYFWIIVSFILGILFGIIAPESALKFEFLGTSFIKLIKMFIGPIIFLTVTTGIAKAGSFKKLGRTGLVAFIYFEIVSTIALLFGWASGSVIKPGTWLSVNIENLSSSSVQSILQKNVNGSLVDFLKNIIPSNIIEPFINGEMLQILLISILFGMAMLMTKTKSSKIFEIMDFLTECFFQIIKMIMYLTPFGVFGAMAFGTAKMGSQFLLPLLGLVATFYLTGIVFITIILGLIARASGFSVWSFIKFIAPEILLILGTSSSETAIAQLMHKLERLGCKRETIGIVVPMGYSLNLDGTNIYITLGIVFLSQALGIELSFSQQLTIFLTAMITSKGAAGIYGSGIIILASTLSVSPIPAHAIIIILSIDKFMSEGRVLVNYIGNGVAALAISRMERELTSANLRKNLASAKIRDEAIPV